MAVGWGDCRLWGRGILWLRVGCMVRVVEPRLLLRLVLILLLTIVTGMTVLLLLLLVRRQWLIVVALVGSEVGAVGTRAVLLVLRRGS